VEEVLASPATLIRHLLVAGHDAVADGTLGLTLQRAGDVAAEGEETVGYAAILLHVD
jgi:hypothetical protein